MHYAASERGNKEAAECLPIEDKSGLLMWNHQLPSRLSRIIVGLLSPKDIQQSSLVCKQWRQYLSCNASEPSRFTKRYWQLPFELSLKILPLLSLKDIEQCRLTCKQWRWDLDSMIDKPLNWLTAPPVLHDVSLHSHNALPMERDEGLYALHPIVNVGNDFFVFERKANERFPTALHVVHKRDYEGSVKLIKQTVWLIPYEVLSVEQVFAVYSKLDRKHDMSFSSEKKESFFITVEIFERKTFKPLPFHVALTNVVAMCQKDNIIYHVCLFQGGNLQSDKRFTLFALNNLQWQELASSAVRSDPIPNHDWEKEHTLLCALNFVTCRPHLQVENEQVMWTCSAHSNRSFLANVKKSTVSMMEHQGGSYYSAKINAPFNCPTVLFGGNVLGLRLRSWMDWTFAKLDLINISADQLLEEYPESRHLQQVCSDQVLVFVMEVKDSIEFLLLCMEKNSCKIRKAKFPYYEHGYYNDIRMVVSECQEQLFIHIISNETKTSLRCSNHLFVVDLTKTDLNSGLRVLNLGVSHYPPAISFNSGFIVQDTSLIQMNEEIQWFRAIKMTSINASGFVQLTQKHKGVNGCGSDRQPVYLTNCKENSWNRLMSYRNSFYCKWCSLPCGFHHYGEKSAFSLRMDPSVLFVDFWMLFKVKDTNGDYIDYGFESRRTRMRCAKGKCKGFLPKLYYRSNDSYMVCKGDGRTCFHARWKDA